MERIRINDFYTELFSKENSNQEIDYIENNLSDIKRFCITNEISKLKIKYFIMRLIMILLEIIDVLVIGSLLFLDDINELLVITFILNIIVGIVFVVSPDIKLEIDNKEEELRRVI